MRPVYYDRDEFFPESAEWTEVKFAIAEATAQGRLLDASKLLIGEHGQLGAVDLPERPWDTTLILPIDRQTIHDILDMAADFPEYSVETIARMLLKGGIQRRKQNVAENQHLQL